MVIQSNMSSKAIIEIWGTTIDVFKKFNVPIAGDPLKTLVDDDKLPEILKELNQTIGSSSVTCTEGG
ncbi:hypothetical protein SAMN05192533_10162 [Mesobacillus persicus]|uniref:Uncharacterized protein n=1 Tax=Mesobacillus persicus TaxID=930146 RepID=A0A1H7VRP6_9BACI|nr:hypothetical protein [Mesobacillus persicus]SEM11468.1 hypothetical protein SAMN05192533_10162 [Mesobacillus persicus]